MKLEEVLPALLEGKKIRAKGWRPECYIMCNKDEFIDERGHEFGFMTIGHLKADWEIDPEPKRVADYFVSIPQCELLDPAKPWFRTVLKYQSTQSVKVGDIYYRDTYAIGEQPKGSVMIPGSERNEV